MTLVLPARLRSVAEHEARRIAEDSASALQAPASARSLRVEVAGEGLSGASLSAAVSRAMASRAGGRD
jgi:hypothetical protein